MKHKIKGYAGRITHPSDSTHKKVYKVGHIHLIPPQKFTTSVRSTQFHPKTKVHKVSHIHPIPKTKVHNISHNHLIPKTKVDNIRVMCGCYWHQYKPATFSPAMASPRNVLPQYD